MLKRGGRRRRGQGRVGTRGLEGGDGKVEEEEKEIAKKGKRKRLSGVEGGASCRYGEFEGLKKASQETR